MITEETLLILGAGASKPYGFPTGRELRTYIFSEFCNDYEKILREYEKRSETWILKSMLEPKEFAEAFKKSSIPSIDQFLALNPNFQNVGKIAIATAILKYEKESRFREDIDNHSKDWYSLLYEKMIEGYSSPNSLERLGRNKVSFMTFNYDRSLEHFLYESLWNSFYEEKDKIALSAKKLIPFPFVHIYGYIDKPVWDGGSQYRVESCYKTIHQLKENIKVIGERPGVQTEEIAKLFAWAKRIFFLGFGFAPENTKVLGLPGIISYTKPIYGTAQSFTKHEIQKVKEFIQRSFPKDRRFETNPIIEDKDCYQFLRDHL